MLAQLPALAKDCDTTPSPQVSLHRRSVSANVNLDEYVQRVGDGKIPDFVPSHPSGQLETYTLVTFSAADTGNPKNWSKLFKWYCTMVVGFTCFVTTFNSSVVTADISGVSKEFGVSDEVSLLTVTLLVIGFGIGPMLFSPGSEIVGRHIIYASTLAVAVVLIIPAALATNIQTLLIARAIDGIALSAPMTLVGGTLADLWKAEERGIPMAAFSAAPFLGPVLGPLAGGFIVMGHSWRWLYWIQLILTGAAWLLITFTVPETHAPTILARRAAKLRKNHADPRYTTEEYISRKPFLQRMRMFLLRPFQLLFREPIVLFMPIYMSVLYGLMYMFFIAYPIVYHFGKGYDSGTTGMMFIPLGVGVLCGAACAPLVNKHYLTLCRKHHGKPPAEVRLIPMMFSCWLVPVGLFIFAWTSHPHLSWLGPAMGGLPVGFGFLFLYNSANNYLVDSYQHQAASVMAAKTFLRSIYGSTTVLFTVQLYERLGLQWASSLLGFVALGCCVIPFIFYTYGARLRLHSKYAYVGEDEKTLKVKTSTETVSTIQNVV